MIDQLLMPVEATDEMIDSAYDVVTCWHDISEEDMKNIYKAMVESWVRQNGIQNHTIPSDARL